MSMFPVDVPAARGGEEHDGVDSRHRLQRRQGTLVQEDEPLRRRLGSLLHLVAAEAPADGQATALIVDVSGLPLID